LAGLARTQGSVFTTQQARAAGYSPDEIRARLSSRRWVRVRRGIYRPSGEADSFAVATAAALLACRRADPVASHRCAAALHGIALLEDPRQPELTLAPTAPTMAVKGCVVHHGLVPAWQRSVVDGKTLTSPARTVIDLAMAGPFAEAVVAADAALRGRKADTEALESAARGFRGSQWAGRIGRVLGFASGRAGSPGESIARVAFAEHNLPAPLLGAPIVVAGQVIAEVDFLWEAQRTVGEFDGRLKYRPDNDRGDDVLWQEKLREERLREAGLEVVRMTWAQVTREPGQTAARVRAAFSRQHERPPSGQ
jgi:hypothetical protein